ncbi:GNAT family N-acetyltransferase [Armatimonas sp.]|uniref:GNAT family N-acetyltransferase n=1 Tax=Armatimonas sp. TaxID=1872638 RepID=UPI00375127A4
MEIATERLIIRPLQLGDEPAFLPLYNTPEVHHPKSPKVPDVRQKELFHLLVQQPPLLSPFVVLAIANPMGACIGLLFLTLHKVPKSRENLAVIGIVISDEWQGEGYGTEACQPVLPFLFEERRVTRVMMGCRKTNLSCQRMIEKLRLEPIPLYRRAALVASGWVAPDELWYELLSTDKGTISA